MAKWCRKYTIAAMLAFMTSCGIEAQVTETVVDTLHNGRYVIIDLPDSDQTVDGDKWKLDEDTTVVEDSVQTAILLQKTDTTHQMMTIDSDAHGRWIPNPKKALWYAIVFPGGGQIYNRKYWKLPLIYGGFLGCVYAINWNNTMYHDYAQAFVDIMDDDPNTSSYYNFLPLNYNVDANLDRLQSLFRKRKDFYRRYRDLSIFCLIGVYALSIVDAYVDAELSSFDISRDLSMKIRPSVISDRAMAISNGNGTSYGVSCAISLGK